MQMMLVMEFVGGGNLAKNLSQDKAEPRKLGWYRNGRFVLLGVARGLAFIHSRNVRATAHPDAASRKIRVWQIVTNLRQTSH